MRILHVTHELPPYELAGTAIYTLNIARAQAEHHDVFVFARLQDPDVPAYRLHTENRDGLTIRFMNKADLEWSPFDDSYRDPKALRLFRDFVEEVAPDVIHFQHIVGLGMDVLDVPRELGITSLYTLHDFWPMCPMGQRMCYTDHVICDPIEFSKCGPCVFGEGWKDVEPREKATIAEGKEPAEPPEPTGFRSRWKRHFSRRYMETPGRFARKPRALLNAFRTTLKERVTTEPLPPHEETDNPFERRFHRIREKMGAIDLLITPSAFLRDEFIKHYDIPPDRIIHSANGMDFSYVKSLPKTKAPNLRIGFMGSIIPTKGVRVLVDGFLDVAKDHGDIELHVHGAPNRWTGDFLQGLKDAAAKHPSGDRAHFHGRYDNKKVGELLADVDVLVVPSIWFENAPLTLNEAAMTRTPIVVSDRGGMLEFVTANSYGRTFKLGDSESLAAALRELAEDRSKVQSLAGDPPTIKSVSANAEELVGVYRGLLEGTYRPPSLDQQTRTRGGILELV